MNEIYLLLGSNLGDSEAIINKAVKMVTAKIGAVNRSSAFYITAAWGHEAQPSFLNKVICVHTLLTPTDVLLYILKIELELGRVRDNKKWQERIIDIDILFYNDYIINEPNLIVPHPHLHERRFTLVPLAEIAPDLIHPLFKTTVMQMLLNCVDKLNVIKK